MKRKKGSKSFSITFEDIIFAGAGALAGMAINPLANKALASQSESIKATAAKAFPAVKVVGGGYLATQKKIDRRLRMAGIGLAAEGSIELGYQFLPAKFVGISINGVGNGDVFDMLGTTAVTDLPILPSASSYVSDQGFAEEQILGTADVYEQSMAIL